MTQPSFKPPTVEQGVNALLEDAKRGACERYQHYESLVRQSPGKAVLVSVAAGYLLHRLPVRSLLVSQVRLVTALAPPTLLAFGAAKLCEFLQHQGSARQPADDNPDGGNLNPS
ncbi:hypothetical protein JIN84_14600 [Luteolibacter yonseiensis]|uniref:Uncharacterized protein n=1 Tax=Luteolibacter yonseiensis TaxID=1144680 RepID=A0A934R4N0_9BACT|nr:hypothetical protein [Luteolibacter yonseiensis]MBK1816852.1 hypothetical protein [Luteolibacter yonseiensis]